MSGFDCTQLQRWLDAGGATTEGDAPAAVAHAAACPDCAALLAAERAVAALFAIPASAATSAVAPGFADRVMMRVALVPQLERVAPAAPPLPIDPLPWWVRVAARPEAVAAALLAGLVVLLAPQLLGFARSAPQWSGATLGALTTAVTPLLAPIGAHIGADPLVRTGVALAFLPLVALLAYALYLLGLQLSHVRFASGAAPGRRA